MFRTFLAVLFFAVAGLQAADTSDGVPKGATETAPGVYRSVDKDGKAWIYRRTPFGIVRRAESDADRSAKEPSQSGERSRMTPFGKQNAQEGAAAPAPAKTSAPPATKVIEDGDNLRFERPGPFGVQKWTRKKDELSAEEKALWDASRSTATAPSGNNGK